MPSIYKNADSNTLRTWLLMTLFFVFIIGIGWLFSYIYDNSAILFIAVSVSFIMSITSYWYSDRIVLSMAKAKPIEKQDNPELYRLVENLSITAGLPLPKIYIINEDHLNAFATGRDKKHAVIAVTRGLLDRLNKTELEGVLAHELSHIGNKDILLSTVVVILAGVVAMLSNLFLRASFFGGMGRQRSEKDDNLFLFLAGIIAAILAPLAATLIQMAISRKREFLADADGALLTRYPEGLADALEKISSDATPLSTANTATSHLYIESPFRGEEGNNWFIKLFSTHPPVEERTKALRDMQV